MQHYWRKCNIDTALNEVLVTLMQYIKGGNVSVKVMVNTAITQRVFSCISCKIIKLKWTVGKMRLMESLTIRGHDTNLYFLE